jgi:hypothetical protein
MSENTLTKHYIRNADGFPQWHYIWIAIILFIIVEVFILFELKALGENVRNIDKGVTLLALRPCPPGKTRNPDTGKCE